MITSVWKDFLTIVREELGSRVIETWFKAVTLDRCDVLSKTIYLHTPNSFVCNWLEKNYKSVCQIHLSRLLNIIDLKVVFITPALHAHEEKSDSNVSERPVALRNKNNISLADNCSLTLYKPAHVASLDDSISQLTGRQNDKHSQINKKYVFDTFVVGPSNSLAYAAASAIAQRPGDLYNPLFVYGDSGLGKTHLLHAIGNDIKKNNPNAVILYQTADRFVSEFINAIRFNKIHLFQKKYQQVDVLLVDDIQFISDKDTTQEAFFHIFNSLYNARKQLVFSSDTFPQNINGIAERLRSRLASGMITDIHQPCLEVKTAILKRKAEASGEQLSDDVAHFLASCVTSNIRELEGALIRVIAYAHLTKQPISLDVAKKIIMPMQPEEKREIIDFRAIIKVINKYYPYTLDDLRSKNRNKDLAFARQLTMYMMKQHTDKSLREIGTFLGGRNHATVKHALSKIISLMSDDSTLQKQIDGINQQLHAFTT